MSALSFHNFWCITQGNIQGAPVFLGSHVIAGNCRRKAHIFPRVMMSSWTSSDILLHEPGILLNNKGYGLDKSQFMINH